MIKHCLPIALLAFIFTFNACNASASEENNSFIKTSRTNASKFDTDFTVAAEKTVNAVVCIKSYVSRPQQSSYNNHFNEMFEFFFGPQPRQPQQENPQSSEPIQSGLGSGVIISEDGYIVTNNHVIDGSEKIEVLMNDNNTYEAKIIGTDEATDLALIKIEATNLSPITFGDSEAVKIGEWVLAVGNPFGFNSTVTAGIVSAKARSLNGHKMGLDSYIQTDAALNPGNSGGALVNLNGELIGINSAIYSNTGSYTGFSFAIPTTIVKKIITDLRQYGTVQRAVLGVTIRELDSKLAKEKGITTTNSGILVVGVEDRSTAKELGLKENDVIIKLNNYEIHNTAQLMEQMNKFRPGDQITVTYIRDNQSYSKTATLRNVQGNTNITKKGDFSELGCAFMKLSDELKSNLGISSGVQVVGLKNGMFKNAGIKENFIIQEINNRPINSADDVEHIFNSIMKSNSDDRVMFISGIYPTGKKYYYAVDLTAE